MKYVYLINNSKLKYTRIQLHNKITKYQEYDKYGFRNNYYQNVWN
jgi:hypothetical protein